MNSSDIRNQLSALGIDAQVLVYQQPLVSVYQGWYRQCPVAIKVLVETTSLDQGQLENECRILRELRHEHVISLYDYFRIQGHFVMILEWCEKDLRKEITQRRGNGFRWTEAELWEMTCDLVKTLAFMQERGLAHRDIKPENLFLSQTSGKTVIKIGDFGESKNLEGQMILTLVGTPYYLSPLLRQGFMTRSNRVQHNAYKSDMYSLGLTLLTCVFLNTPVPPGQGIGDEMMSQVIESAACSEKLKGVLRWMLVYEESRRCDFVELNSWLEAESMSQVGKEFSDSQVLPQVQRAQSESMTVLQRSPRHLIAADKPHSLPAPTGVQAVKPVQCIECGGGVDRELKEEVVQLYCDPATHLFCSRACFAQFCNRSEAPVCPKCGIPVSRDVLDAYNKGLIARGLEAAQNYTNFHPQSWPVFRFFSRGK